MNEPRNFKAVDLAWIKKGSTKYAQPHTDHGGGDCGGKKFESPLTRVVRQ